MYAATAGAATLALILIYRRVRQQQKNEKRTSTTPKAVTHDTQVSATFSLMTYNLWKTNGEPTAWTVRRPILLRQLRRLNPDVMFAQELCPKISSCVIEALPGHHQVKDNDLQGWAQEGNIFWRASLFQELDHGAVDIGQAEKHRRLFWVKLIHRETDRKALFATAHFSWRATHEECVSDVNVRKAQARRTAEALMRLQGDCHAIFFGGDLNESFWPLRILQQAGFIDCFAALSLPVRATHPTRPVLAHEEVNADAALDWLFYKGDRVQVLLSAVINCMTGLSSDDPDESQVLSIQPSDHMPVMSVLRIT